jgi:hypothetical protein
MTIGTAKKLAEVALSATTTTVLYTAPASTTAILKEIVLCNTDTVDRTVTIQAGSGTGVASRILSAYIVKAGTTSIFTFSTVVLTGETITGGASAASVVGCKISGGELV